MGIIDLLRFGLAETAAGVRRRGRMSRWPPRPGRLQSADDLRLAAQRPLPRSAGADDEAGGASSDIAAARKALDDGASDDELVALSGGLAELSLRAARPGG